jgi:hypothetical protein
MAVLHHRHTYCLYPTSICVLYSSSYLALMRTMTYEIPTTCILYFLAASQELAQERDISGMDGLASTAQDRETGAI